MMKSNNTDSEFGPAEPKFRYHDITNGWSKEASNDFHWTVVSSLEVELDQKTKFNKAQIKRWCENNCEDSVLYIEFNNLKFNDKIYFFLEEDAMAFKLRWT